MASEGVPALLEALFIYENAEKLDKATKSALRLCNKHFKNLVDATVVEATLNLDLNALLNTEWHRLEKLQIVERIPGQNRLTELPSALFVKFSRLETLRIHGCRSLEALPEEIGELSHLKLLNLHLKSLVCLPSSLGKLTTLEKIVFAGCYDLTTEGIGPLQHLTGLTSLSFCSCNREEMINYPDFICNLTALKQLALYSNSINTLPAALGNLTNLEFLAIHLFKLKELPKSIGDLNSLKTLRVSGYKLATLPESLDDLLWRKAHETEKMELADFSDSPKLVFSAKMEQGLELLEQHGVNVRRSYEF